MTRRQRLMATLRGEPVDRPAVSFYEIGGVYADPDNPDVYNVYNDQSWRPLLALAEEKTDLIRMRGPRVRARWPDAWGEMQQRRVWEEQTADGPARFERVTQKVAGHEMTSLTRRDAAVDTVWVIEHLLKSPEDVEAYLQIPEACFEQEVEVESLVAEDEKVGEAGIVMVDTADPLCMAASLFSMEDYTTIAFTEESLFHRLLERFAKPLQARTERVATLFPGHLWRIYGPEYASEPFLPARLFDAYVVRYVEPMVRAISQQGGFARIHCHGRVKGILPKVAAMGAAGTDPVEPPPQGDVTLREARELVGAKLVLFGNLEITDIENMAPDAFEAVVRQALIDGTGGRGRGFVLMPSACPYGRTITPRTMANYQTMVRLVEAMAAG